MSRIMLIVVAALSLLASAYALAAENVAGHLRKNGKYVHSYKRSNPDNKRYNNYSSKGNRNPYTGKNGTHRNEFSKPVNHDKNE